jgi:hypothetical protein
VPAADSPDQAALREKLNALSRQKLQSVCKSVFPPPDVSWFGLQREQKVIVTAIWANFSIPSTSRGRSVRSPNNLFQNVFERSASRTA